MLIVISLSLHLLSLILHLLFIVPKMCWIHDGKNGTSRTDGSINLCETEVFPSKGIISWTTECDD